ncbi:MAG: spermidine/putrescine ABC transporter substrate-binding protein [Gammaproteobacteria bacterium]|nr:spermidine/putrescine ABC transporter substrate-binding protein [Gammaproteobacteria bacterium]
MRAPNIQFTISAFCGFCMGMLSIFPAWSADSAPVLSVLTWSEYLDPEIVEAFQAKTGYQLKFTYFETDETRDDYLIATDGSGYDLIMMNGYTMQMYQQRGWLAQITPADVPNLKHIDPKWLPRGTAAEQLYGVPYFWGTLGIAYREDLVSKPITRWMDLFDPAPELHGRIVMIKHSRDLIGMALLARGHSVNSTDPAHLAEARDLLIQQRPYVKSYSYVSLSEDSSLVKGTVLAAQVYSGDALMLQEHNPHIRYVAPDEGTNLWIDFWAVAAKSQNKEAAFAFIDYINEPENAAQIAEFVHYATPNLAADKLLSDEHHADPVINPSSEILKRSEFYNVLPPRVTRKWNAVFAEVVN